VLGYDTAKHLSARGGGENVLPADDVVVADEQPVAARVHVGAVHERLLALHEEPVCRLRDTRHAPLVHRVAAVHVRADGVLVLRQQLGVVAAVVLPFGGAETRAAGERGVVRDARVLETATRPSSAAKPFSETRGASPVTTRRRELAAAHGMRGELGLARRVSVAPPRACSGYIRAGSARLVPLWF
jgi:hypothetical protein